MNDAYISALSKIIISLESLYGLRDKNKNGVLIGDTGINDVMQYVEQGLATTNADRLNEKNTKASRDLILLAYLSGRMEYFGLTKLNYSHYPALKPVAEVLLEYTKAKNINGNSIHEIGKIIRLLQSIDENQVRLRIGLAYKYLRIFAILVVNKNLTGAYVVADLILSQFREGVNRFGDCKSSG